MRVGLLWYDDDKRKSPVEKIDEARLRYQERFGSEPDTCHVNPEDRVSHPQVRVVASKHIGRNYYWVGEETGTEPVVSTALAG